MFRSSALLSVAVAVGLMFGVLSSSSPAAITGYWALDEGAGTTAFNQVSGGANGTLSNEATGGLGAGGSAWITNDPFRGTLFSGNGNDSTGAFISAGSVPQAEINGNFTWVFWAALQGSGTGGNDVVLGNRFGGPGWTKFTPSNFEWQPGAGGGNVDIANVPLDNSWHHHAIVKNGSNFQYYLDGLPGATANYTGTFSGAVPFFIGGDSGGERPAGRYSEVATFNQSLTQPQIQAIRNGDFSEFGFGGPAAVEIPVATLQQNSTGFSVANDDLIEGIAATVTGSLGGQEGTSSNPLTLTNGTFGPADLSNLGEVVAIGNNTTLTYQLDLAAGPFGYEITGIDTYSGWRDGGRDGQAYTVQVAFLSDLTTFVPLADVAYNPAGLSPTDTAAFLTNPLGGPMASRVGAVRFIFGVQENGYVGYRELDVFGVASVPEPSSLTLAVFGLFGLTVCVQRRRRR